MKRLLHLIFYVILINMFLSSCTDGKKQGSDNHYILASLKGPSSMGILPLIDSLDKAESPNLEISISSEPLQVRKMMLDGTADFAILPTTMAALLYNKGVDYQIVAVPVWGTLYLCGSCDSIEEWNDLKAKNVYLMAKGMTPDVLFRYLLKENDLQPYTDVNLDYRFPSHIDLANAVLAGRADIAVLSEPYLSLALLKNNELKRFFDLGEKWYELKGFPIAETALLCKSEIVKNDPDFIDDLLRMYSQSTDWVNDNEDKAAAMAVKYDIIPDSIAAKNSISHSNLKVSKTEDVKNLIEQYLKVFYEMDPQIIGGKMPDEDFYQK